MSDEFPEDYDEEVEEFQCRVCGKDCTHENGDDYVLLCDDCAENYNMDKLWADWEEDKITEEELKTVDLNKYKI
jgi:hypothetical protein